MKFFKLRILNFQNKNTKIINKSYEIFQIENSKIFKRERKNDVTK